MSKDQRRYTYDSVNLGANPTIQEVRAHLDWFEELYETAYIEAEAVWEYGDSYSHIKVGGRRLESDEEYQARLDQADAGRQREIDQLRRLAGKYPHVLANELRPEGWKPNE